MVGHLVRFCVLLCPGLVSGCITQPKDTAAAALYRDLRTIVDAAESDGWLIDDLRLRENAEPALKSVCAASPEAPAELRRWLGEEILRRGGSAELAYRANGGDVAAVSPLLSLERTRALLDFALAQAAALHCPFWLKPEPAFLGTQGDAQRWVVLAETQAFASYVLDSQTPALGGGGRLLVGHGISSELTLAVGGDLAAAGTFIPTQGHGLDATFTIAAPVLLRLRHFSRLFDVVLAPISRFLPGWDPWPPGVRIELGAGWSSIRKTAMTPYFMLYAGYEYHFASGRAQGDHTLQLGTRLAFDWVP